MLTCKSKSLCQECGSQLIQINGVYVCEVCEAVVAMQEANRGYINDTIRDVIDTIQNNLLTKEKTLYRIETKTGESEDETAIKTFCREFLDCRIELNLYLQNGNNTDEKFRTKAYTLLKLNQQYEDSIAQLIDAAEDDCSFLV